MDIDVTVLVHIDILYCYFILFFSLLYIFPIVMAGSQFTGAQGFLTPVSVGRGRGVLGLLNLSLPFTKLWERLLYLSHSLVHLWVLL